MHNAPIYLIALLLQVYTYVIIARVLCTWLPIDPRNPLVSFLARLTDPVLDRFRAILPLQFGGLDLTPAALILFLALLERFLLGFFR